MSRNVDEAQRRAEALFKKEQQLREGQQAMAEYQAELRAMREKTARLRALLRRCQSEGIARQPEGSGVTAARRYALLTLVSPGARPCRVSLGGICCHFDRLDN